MAMGMWLCLPKSGNFNMALTEKVSLRYNFFFVFWYLNQNISKFNALIIPDILNSSNKPKRNNIIGHCIFGKHKSA